MEINYGKSLKEQRENLGLSLKKLSTETGISFQNLSRWERNEVIPKIDFCVILADYYKISLDELINREIPNKSIKTTTINNSFNGNNNQNNIKF